MAINPLNWNFQPLKLGPDFGAFAEAIKGGAQRAEERGLNLEKRKEMQLSNAFQKARAPYAQDIAEAELEKTRAEAARAPFIGLSGEASRLFSLEMLKKQYGQDSDVYQNAKAAYDLEQQNLKSQIRNRDKLTETADKRSSTSLTKTGLELQDAIDGYRPGTNRQVMLDPSEQNHIIGQLENKLLKESTDSATRNSALQARKLDTTAEAINLDSLANFSGPKGTAKLAFAKANSIAGNPSKEYLEYEQNVTRAHDLANQIRAVLGLSITPSQTEILEELSNPTGWSVDPKVAKAKMKANLDLILKESRQAVETLESPGGLGLRTKTKQIPSGHNGNEEAVNEMITLRNKKTGQTETVTIEEARKRGAIQ